MIKLLFRPKTGLDWGLNPGPYLILWPFLASWSIPPLIPVRAWPSWELGCWSERELRRASHPSEGVWRAAGCWAGCVAERRRRGLGLGGRSGVQGGDGTAGGGLAGDRGRAAGWGRRGCWDAWRREARLFLGVPPADGSCWLSLVLSPYSVPARLLRTRPKGALRERFAAMSLCMETGLDVQGSLSLPGTQLSQWGGPGPPPKATLPQRWATRAHEEYGVFPGSA